MGIKENTEQGHIPRALYKDWKYGGVRCEDIDWQNRLFTFVCNGTTTVYDENDGLNMTPTKRELIDDVVEHVKKKAVEMSVTTTLDSKDEKADGALVKSSGIWAPQNYLGLVTGIYYCLKYNKPPVSEIKMLLKANGKKLRDYPMDRIDLIVKDKVNVILVDVSHYKGDTYIKEYRWFEIDCDVNEDVWG